MSVADEHRMTPSKVLARPKSTDKKTDKDDKKSPKHSAMLDFISKCKKESKEKE